MKGLSVCHTTMSLWARNLPKVIESPVIRFLRLLFRFKFISHYLYFFREISDFKEYLIQF